MVNVIIIMQKCLVHYVRSHLPRGVRLVNDLQMSLIFTNDYIFQPSKISNDNTVQKFVFFGSEKEKKNRYLNFEGSIVHHMIGRFSINTSSAQYDYFSS